ncbi:MAG: pentapeptide repeat-containing protein [Rhodobacter sp.]|nr:pentapeptide repeat-containing protein [Rhodobacter sp.]
MAASDASRGIQVPLPLTAQEGWVLLTALGIAVLSGLVWLVLQDAPARKAQGENWALSALNTFALMLVPVWFVLFAGVLYGFWRLFSAFDATLTGEGLRWHVLAFVGLITALGALATAPLAMIRVYTTERQTRVAEQGHMTDRISKAVEQLGAEKTVKRRVTDGYGKEVTVEETVPNIEVRIGGIYALERIAQDSTANDRGRDHIRVMELLCAYIRENAPAAMAKDHPFGPWQPLPPGASAAEREAHMQRRATRLEDSQVGNWACGLARPRTDIQTALTVIGRRSAEQIALERAAVQPGEEAGYRLDLRHSCLRRADLSSLSLERARFEHARMEGADLNGARMEGADLSGAQMEGADLSRAQMEGAFLFGAQMEGANLRRAQMEGANLSAAQMEGANLSDAQMERAKLSDAQMEGAKLSGAQMEGANLFGAQMEGADLSGAQMEGADLCFAQIEGADLSEAQMEGAKLWRAQMEGANLWGANLIFADLSDWSIARTSLRSADLSEAKNLEQHDVNAAWGDSGTSLPDGIQRPDHWDTETLEHDYVPDLKYLAWIAAGAPPGKPLPPASP